MSLRWTRNIIMKNNVDKVILRKKYKNLDLNGSKQKISKGKSGIRKAISLNFDFFFLAVLCSLWDLSSLTRDRTQALGSESTES